MTSPGAPALGPEDHAQLGWARTLGRRGWGHVHPNPMVGCVLVRRGRVVGEGYHREFGGPHAEIVALEEARSRAEGATAYVSLEPCDHQGKTPPCSGALVQAGIARVVFGVADPGRLSGGGAETLRRAGIDVVGPVWTAEVGRAENPAFFHTARHDSPYIALKLALSLDGRIASAPGVRTRITGPEADREVHRLRTGFDAILVGAGTVRADDPRLTVRLVPPGRCPPRRLVLDTHATLDPGAALFEETAEAPVHVFVHERSQEAAIARLEATGAHVHPVPGPAEGPGLALDAVLSVAWDVGIRSILCEGGAGLAATLLLERRVQRLYLFFSPQTLGSAALAGFRDELAPVWSDFAPPFDPELHGRDTLVVLDRKDG